MDNKISRREALRKILVYSTGIMVTPSLLGFTSELFAADKTNRSLHDFYLQRVIETLIGSDGEVPLKKKRPDNYDSQYEIYSLIAANSYVPGKVKTTMKGHISVSRRSNTSGAELNIRIMRHSSFKHHQFIAIDQTINDDSLSSPKSWTYDARVTTGATEQPMYGKAVIGEARVSGREITIVEGSRKALLKPDADKFTINWNLMDAVKRIKEDQHLEFETIDEYDVLAGKKVLKPYKRADIEIGGNVYTLRSFVMLGRSTLPTFYWLNDSGELLFVNTGMEVYILQS